MVRESINVKSKFLEDKGLTYDSASAAQLSDADAFEKCYNFYINTLKVLPENAEIASTVWVQKYALHDKDGMCLEKTPADMWDRLANALAEEEIETSPKLTQEDKPRLFTAFREALDGFKYTPQGSGLFALGNPYVKSSASNCFVLPSPEDSLDSIFETAKLMAKIYSFRGGIGIDISNLRPYGAATNNAARSSTGAASFMDFYSYVTGMIGQCIEENQLVLTKRGNIPIKDVVADDLVWTKKGWIRNLETVYSGVKPVYKLVTQRGFEVLATENHVLVGSEKFNTVEKQLGDFKVGDAIVMVPGTVIDIPYVSLDTNIDYDQGHGADNKGNRLNTSITLPTELTEDLAYFVGYSFGDGYVELDTFGEPVRLDLACSHSHPRVKDKLVASGASLFNYTPKVNSGDGAVDTVTIHSKLLGLYLAQNGLLKQKAEVLEMPDAIKRSRTSVQMAFISGYFDADGCASGAKKGYVIASICMPILKDMQQMLMSAGIVSHITTEKRNGLAGTENWQDLHSLSITGASSQQRAVTILTESCKISEKAFVAKRDRVLTPFNARSYGISYNKFSYVPDNTQYLSARAFTRLQESGHISDNILIQDEVASIDLVGDAKVYDLRLESEHLFSCQSFQVHNSGRRGALMLTMRVDHPDIIRFIEMKRDLDKKPFFDELAECGIDINDFKWSGIADRLKSTSYANVSVRVTDEFMTAVKNDTDFELKFDYTDEAYPNYRETIRARDLWEKLMHSAWESAEPGILNWDHILTESPADQYINLTNIEFTDPKTGEVKTVDYSFRTLSTNPCGEVPLSGGDSCCLGTFYLPAFVKNPWTKDAYFDFDMYEKHVRIGVAAQDNIKNWDSKILPLEINRISAVLGRRISLGNHGLADCLASLGLRYDSDEAIKQTEAIYEFLKNTAYGESACLAEQKGTFTAYDCDTHMKSPFIQRLSKDTLKSIRKHGLRNIALLTNAPTGSMSILSRNCSSGIEPVFMLSYTRNVKIPGTNDFEKFTLNHQAVQDCIDAGGDTSVFVEANNIIPEKRIALQAAIQRHIDHAISVTTNLKSDTSVEEVDFLYQEAFNAGCKGFTVYRDGCRTGVLNSIKSNKVHKTLDRPKTTNIDIHKVKYRDKQWAVLVGRLDSGPIEVFAGIEEDTPLPNKYHKAELTKKSRGHYSLTVYLSEDEDDIIKINNIGARFPLPEGMTLTRFISLALKNGVAVSDICEQLTKSSNSMFDYPAVLNRVLKNYITEDEFVKKVGEKACPDCGKPLQFRRQDGCLLEFCDHCSYINSKCG